MSRSASRSASRRRAAPATSNATSLLGFVHPVLAFILEVAMLAGVGYWGFKGGFSAPWTYLLGIGLPAALIVLWGVFLAPKAPRRVPAPLNEVVALALFVLAAAALMVSRQPGAGWVMVVLAVGNFVLGLYLRRRG
ncbi:MAG: YrdB family protein [Actinomycetales bacterium]